MTCPVCGSSVGDNGLCMYHLFPNGESMAEWSRANRAVCDWIHRKIEPLPVTKTDQIIQATQTEDTWTASD